MPRPRWIESSLAASLVLATCLRKASILGNSQDEDMRSCYRSRRRAVFTTQGHDDQQRNQNAPARVANHSGRNRITSHRHMSDRCNRKGFHLASVHTLCLRELKKNCHPELGIGGGPI